MVHEISFQLLSEYSDGRCPVADKARVDKHLHECAACKETINLLKDSDIVLSGLDRLNTSLGFDREFDRRLEERIALSKEGRLGLVVKGVFEKVRDAVTIPAPALAGAAIFTFLIFASHAVLNYALVESPVISAVSGDVAVFNKKSGQWYPATAAGRLSDGDIMEAKSGSGADIVHGNKYTMRIKENSRIRIARRLPKYVKGICGYDIEKGKALVSVSSAFKGSKLIIKTPEATATVLGTEFVVDVFLQPQPATRFGVFEGSLKVESAFRPKDSFRSRQVIVNGGQATEIFNNSVPSDPRQLLAKEWKEMEEFYQIGKKSKVVLLITNETTRTKELLRPCALYISDAEPRALSDSLEETIRLIDSAIKSGDKEKHFEGIRRLEAIVANNPNPDYEPQLLLFIGAYYNYLNMYPEAIKTFQKAASKYPESTFASMALCAISLIYDEKMNDEKASANYRDMVLERYPNSPEAGLFQSG